MKRVLMVAVALLAQAALAEEPCAPSLEGTTVKTSAPLTGVPKEDECLKSIATFLAAREDVSDITVELRTKDDDRVAGKALANAKRIAGVLTAAGAKNVSYVVPRSDGLELGVVVTVALKPDPAPIAIALNPKGEVTLSRPARHSLQQINGVTNILPMDLVTTNQGRVTVAIPNAALLYVGGGSNIALAAPDRISVTSGALRIETSEAKVLQFSVGDSTVSVGPGALLEIESVTGHPWHVAVERGQVEVKSAQSSVIVPPGHGTASSGTSVEAVRALLAAPKLSPQLNGRSIRWEPVPGASSYRVELSPDAAFGPSTEFVAASTTSASIDDAPAVRFFRVRAVDGNGLPGLPSKAYSANR